MALPYAPSFETIFQSTLSMRRAKSHLVDNGNVNQISIHALHEESELANIRRVSHIRHFNPRSP